ncbi:MAG: aminoacyl-tRNA hydrolase [Dehalococcoidia bacterium]|nr:aminoacyl-tRNA hydrolase [Dehalococcoidia bacterium]
MGELFVSGFEQALHGLDGGFEQFADGDVDGFCHGLPSMIVRSLRPGFACWGYGGTGLQSAHMRVGQAMAGLRKLLGRKQKSLQADWLVVGLGNPGPKYANNRHNVGFWVVNELAKRANVQQKSAGASMVAGVGQLSGATVALVKPMTFMNHSGKAVAQALKASECDLQHTIRDL